MLAQKTFAVKKAGKNYSHFKYADKDFSPLTGGSRNLLDFTNQGKIRWTQWASSSPLTLSAYTDTDGANVLKAVSPASNTNCCLFYTLDLTRLRPKVTYRVSFKIKRTLTNIVTFGGIKLSSATLPLTDTPKISGAAPASIIGDWTEVSYTMITNDTLVLSSQVLYFGLGATAAGDEIYVRDLTMSIDDTNSVWRSSPEDLGLTDTRITPLMGNMRNYALDTTNVVLANISGVDTIKAYTLSADFVTKANAERVFTISARLKGTAGTADYGVWMNLAYTDSTSEDVDMTSAYIAGKYVVTGSTISKTIRLAEGKDISSVTHLFLGNHSTDSANFYLNSLKVTVGEPVSTDMWAPAPEDNGLSVSDLAGVDFEHDRYSDVRMYNEASAHTYIGSLASGDETPSKWAGDYNWSKIGGADSYIAIVEPNNIVIPFNQNGTLDLSNAKATIKVMKGLEEITSSINTSGMVATSCSASVSGNTVTMTSVQTHNVTLSDGTLLSNVPYGVGAIVCNVSVNDSLIKVTIPFSLDWSNYTFNSINGVQNEIDAINSSIDDMASDSKLTPSEKSIIRKDLDSFAQEKAKLDAQAVAYGITTEKTNYDTSYDTLNAYVGGIVADANLNTTSDINGATLRADFADYFLKRTILQNKIADTAKTLANAYTDAGIGNIQIGGRNLAVGYGQYTKNNPFVRSSPNADGAFMVVTPTDKKFFLGAGEYRVNVDTDGIWDGKHVTDGHIANNPKVCVFLYLYVNEADTNYTKEILLQPDGVYKPTTDGYYRFRVNTYSDGTTVCTHKFWNFKVEKGNKKTDYTEAPEDIQARIDSDFQQQIASVDVEYALGDNSTTAPTTGWQTTSPTWTAGKFVWSRVKTYLQNGTSSTSDVACIQGATGKGISSIKEQYYKSTSATSLAGGSWVDTVPVQERGYYIWTHSVISYTDNTTLTTNPVRTEGIEGLQGLQGPTGDKGVGISSVVEHYLATSASSGVTTATSGWTTAVQAITSTNKYLWNYETINYTEGSPANTTPVIVGVYGNTGKGISSVVEHYLATSAYSGVSTATSGWTTGVQSVNSTNKYLWNYETINYTEGAATNTTPVIIGTYGDKGDSAINYKLVPSKEDAIVTKGTTDWQIAVSLEYQVQKTVGDQVTYISPADDGLTFSAFANTSVGTTEMNISISNGVISVTYTSSTFSGTNRFEQIIVGLAMSPTNYDTRLVNVKVKNDVQLTWGGDIDAIKGEIRNADGSFSTLKQRLDSIDSTVSGKVSTSVFNQLQDNLTLEVARRKGNLAWYSGFEPLADWGTRQNSGVANIAAGYYTLDKSIVKYPGVNSLKIQVTGLSTDSWAGLWGAMNVAVQPNTPYTFSFWDYTDSLASLESRPVYFEIKTFDSSGTVITTNYSYSEATPSVNGTWQFFSKTFTTPATAVKVSVFVGLARNGRIWITCPNLIEGTKYDNGYLLANGESLLPTGINVQEGKIDMAANDFTLRNNSGDVTMGVNADGDLEVSGVIKAETLLQNYMEINTAFQDSTFGIYSNGTRVMPTDIMLVCTTANQGATTYLNVLYLPWAGDCVGRVLDIYGENYNVMTGGTYQPTIITAQAESGYIDQSPIYSEPSNEAFRLAGSHNYTNVTLNTYSSANGGQAHIKMIAINDAGYYYWLTLQAINITFGTT